VQGLRGRALAAVRHAQVIAVNAMMRYARGAIGPAPGDEVAPATDVEVGDEPGESESEEAEPSATPPALEPLVTKALKQLDVPGAPARDARAP
jgi:hypothetical protein